MEVLTWCIDPNGIENKNTVKYMACFISVKKMQNPYYWYADDIKGDDTKPTLL